jgi:hypothetical protein
LSYEVSGILAEHEGVRSIESHGSTYDPSPEEKAALKLAEKLFQRAKNSRKPYDEKWLDFYKMFRGKQWKDARPSYRHSEVVNLIFRAIQSEVPILTDVLPKPEFVPQEPNDMELARILNDVMAADWIYNNWAYKFTEILFEAHIYGTGFGKTGFDADACNGIGSAEFESADPFYQYPSPNSKDVNGKKSNYYIEAEPVDLDILKAEYPEKAHYMKADVLDISRRDKQQNDQVRYKSPTDNRSIVDGSTALDLDARNEVLKVTLWIKDMETVEEEAEKKDEATGEVSSVFVKKLKYPAGRKIVMASGVLLEDGPMEEWREKKFPFIRLTNYMLPREFWGMSDVEQLESPQKIFNKLISFNLDIMTMMGNPIWVVDSTSGIDTDNLTNRPGLVVEKEPNSEARREAGVSMDSSVMAMIDRVKVWFDDVSGSTDASRGVKPEGVQAASAIEALQDAQQTRLRQKGRFIDAFMQDFGQMWLDIVFEFYKAPRMYRITNDQNVTKYFKFHVDEKPVMQDQPVLDEMGQPALGADGAPMMQQVPTGEIQKVALMREQVQGDDGKFYEGQQQEYNLSKKFDIKISTGSALPFEKSKIEQQSLNLFDRQILDAEEVLKNINYPNREIVLKRMAEKAAMAAQAEMQAQAQPVA